MIESLKVFKTLYIGILNILKGKYLKCILNAAVFRMNTLFRILTKSVARRL